MTKILLCEVLKVLELDRVFNFYDLCLGSHNKNEVIESLSWNWKQKILQNLIVNILNSTLLGLQVKRRWWGGEWWGSHMLLLSIRWVRFLWVGLCDERSYNLMWELLFKLDSKAHTLQIQPKKNSETLFLTSIFQKKKKTST